MRQCAGLDFFPADAELRGLLVERLHRLASDHKHAGRMIDHWLDTQTVAPKVADLVTLAQTIHGSATTDGTLPAPCERCRDNHSGGNWIDYGLDSDGNERGWGRCNCERGQALRALDRQHANDR
ncbi:MAG: hypothetical protein ABSB23_17475 [Bryobacteraceae bacterium]